MEIYLTSSPFAGHEDPAQDHTQCADRPISEANGFAERLKKSAAGCRRGLLVASDPDNAAFTEMISADIKKALFLSGISFESWKELDRRNQDNAAGIVSESDFIVLAGGHTPTQNRFFHEIGLRKLLEKKSGKCVLMGISAGSMNAASLVYAQPEEEGESLDPKYERFLPGLGLTDVMIIPHYQRIRDRILDGKRLFEEITVPDSMGRYLYLLSDGSYLYTNGDISRIYGELHIMKDGVIRRVANEGGTTALISE